MRFMRFFITVALLLAILASFPFMLLWIVGNPLAGLPDLQAGDISERAAVDALAILALLAWGQFACVVAVEAVHILRRRPAPLSAPHAGLWLGQRHAARTLIAATVALVPAAALPGHALAAIRPPVSQSVNLHAGSEEYTSAPAGRATLLVGERRYSYAVRPGDTLSGIAQTWLSDAMRWPEICRLNQHRHLGDIGGTLRDCDLIYPGWQLRLPHDAIAPAPRRGRHLAGPERSHQSTPARPAPDRTAAPSPPVPSNAAERSVTPTARRGFPSGSVTTAPPAIPSPSKGPSVPPSSPQTKFPPPTQKVPRTSPPPSASAGRDSSTTSPSSTAHVPSPDPMSADRDGAYLEGGWIPWSLASGIGAAIGLIWLQRRRNHLLGKTDDNASSPPSSAEEASQLLGYNSDEATQPNLSEHTSGGPVSAPLTPGGVGLIGEGAHAAARAALTAVLASGDPSEPELQGEVVIDIATLTTLLGADATDLEPWSRLHVVEDLDHGLSTIEALLLHRARIVNEKEATDLSDLRERNPPDEPLPPVLLITSSPPLAATMRTHTSLSVGAALGISALLLGEWRHGPTLDVDADGRPRPVGEPSPQSGLSERMGVLDAKTTIAFLTTLREAHTGERPVESNSSPISVIDEQTLVPERGEGSEIQRPSSAGDPSAGPDAEVNTSNGVSLVSESAAPPPDPSAPAGKGRARLNVFGEPQVKDLRTPGHPLRAKARELAVFLACHPDGADTRSIGDYLEPDVRLRHADTRVHTNVSNLRHVMGRAGGIRRRGYVVKNGGRYRLDRSDVEVDLWEFQDLIARVATASPNQRISLLRKACDLYAGPLADRCDYDWIEAHRERARQQASEAHLQLAEQLLPTDPQAACKVLDRAIQLDQYNEAIYCAAMLAHHRMGDQGRIRALLRALTTALAELDTEPDEATIALAHRLQSEDPPRSPTHPGADPHPDSGQASVPALFATLIVIAICASLTSAWPSIASKSGDWGSTSFRGTLTGSLLVLALTTFILTRRMCSRSARNCLTGEPFHDARPRSDARELPEFEQSRRLSMYARLVLVPVAVIGAVLSFRSLYQAAVPTFGPCLAAGFPLLVDLLILGSSLQYVAGAKVGRPMTGWRLTAHVGVAATLTLNALAAHQLGDVPWHVTAPAVWAILVELTAKQVLGEWQATHTGRSDVIPLSLWLTAPIESTRTRLHMLRTGILDARAARIAVGKNAAAREVVLLSLPTRQDHRTRKVIHRQLRAGSLEPTAILQPLGWTQDNTPGLSLASLRRPNVLLLAAVLQNVLAPMSPSGNVFPMDIPDRAGCLFDDVEPAVPAAMEPIDEATKQPARTISTDSSSATSMAHAGPPVEQRSAHDGTDQLNRPDSAPASKAVERKTSVSELVGPAATLDPGENDNRISASSATDDHTGHAGRSRSRGREARGRRRTTDDRRLAAIGIVRQQPSISGTDLAAALNQHGWTVSPRTGQRLLADIHQAGTTEAVNLT
jgi:DNA-binding SARP family transcriptional activator